jgi:general secretion pathway protein E
MTDDRTSYDRLLIFVHGLALRLSAGASLADALAALQAGTADALWREGIASLRERVDQGERLSEAIWQRRDLFPYLLGVMVRRGELTGRFGQSLRRYAEYLRKELALVGPHPSENTSSMRELALWCHRVGMLWQCEVPILETLEVSVAEMPTSDALREAVLILRQTIREGGRLSEKMAEFPGLFPETVRQMFAVGEETGSLSEAVLCLAETLETLDRCGVGLAAGGSERASSPVESRSGAAEHSEEGTPGSQSEELPGSALASALIEDAIRHGASDVHLQPTADHHHRLRVRYRVDGALRTVQQIEGPGRASLIARLKSMARMDVADRRLPQRGRILFREGDGAAPEGTGQEYHLRLLTYPYADEYEGIALRIHPQQAIFAGLTELGMTAEQAEQCRRLLNQPCGIVAVAGVSGSGRTTTLYTMLRELHREGALAGQSVVTLESPVEMPWGEINQISLDAASGLTLPEAMRGVLRQDPDLLMVSEVRDLQGMAAVVHAAVEGHRVLIGLTAADAGYALEQLTQWEPQRAAGHLLAIIAQRLVRRPCDECAGSGCEACRRTGYRGRTAVFEVLSTTSPAMRRLLRARASRAELYACAAREGVIPLAQAVTRLGADRIENAGKSDSGREGRA